MLLLTSRGARLLPLSSRASILGRARGVSSSAGAHKARLRFAPSPTGHLHLGGLRTALFNHLLARQWGGSWVLRIEDTDRNRLVPGAVQALQDTLKWAGLLYDEGPDIGGPYGPYVQSERLDLYRSYSQKLLDTGNAYRCFCSPDRLANVRESLHRNGSHATYDRRCLGLPDEEVARNVKAGMDYVVRLKSHSTPSVVNDLVYGTMTLANETAEDVILLKSDGYPTYHLASVVDDYEMSITHVLRGEEWLPSLPKHLMIYDALGLPRPQFAHLPILVNADGSKLSKRSGDVRVEEYRANGWDPEALLNFVVLLGWNRHSTRISREASGHCGGSPSEVLSLEDMVREFSLADLSRNRPTIFSGKLAFLGKQHLHRKLETPAGMGDVIQSVQAAVRDAYGDCIPRSLIDRDYLTQVITVIKDRAHNIHELVRMGNFFFVEPDLQSEEALQWRAAFDDALYDDVISASMEELRGVTGTGLDEATVASALRELARSRQWPTKKMMSYLRHAITGQKAGPGMAAIIAILGQETTLMRLNAAYRPQPYSVDT